MWGRIGLSGLVVLAAASAKADAQTASTDQSDSAAKSIATVTVVGTTPLPGTSIDPDKLPGNIQTITATDLTREGSASVISAINDDLGSVSINDDLDDPFQPDILFRGFEASPVLGTPEGLAVYQNGVRINEAFGDALNWDLFPDVAIDRVSILSSNPVYGLNALGGAVVVSMKNGFTAPGGSAELSGGSWGQRNISLEYGANSGPFGIYAAGRALEEDGWRQFSPDSIKQFYSDFSYHDNGITLDLSFTGANNRLSGESPTPVQQLATSWSSIFTSPQNNINELEFVP
jgi:iron complex outermembrane receptor protein